MIRKLSAVLLTAFITSGFWTAAPAAAQSQATNGTIEGIVTDSSGGVLPGVTVTVTNEATGLEWTEVTTPTGTYTVTNLPVGTYKVTARITHRDGRVEIVEASYMDIAPKSVDLAVIVMAYHDAYWIDEKEGWPAINTDGFVESIKRMLKPGGKLLIVDHNAAPGTGKEAAGTLHRLNEDWAKKSLTSHGFVFEKSYDGLRNPNDQLDKMVYDPAVKGKTDRYVHLYRLK